MTFLKDRKVLPEDLFKRGKMFLKGNNMTQKGIEFPGSKVPA